MKALLQKKVPPIIGLDIGTRFVKAVLLEKAGDQYSVNAFACEPITGNAFTDRQVKDFDAVSNALRKVKLALKNKKIKDVAIAVAGSSVLTKIVQMEPDQTDYQLEGQIEVEADSLIPYPLEEVYLDFEELGPSKTHVNKVNVLLSAAHKDVVDSRVTLLREIPFEPKVIDIEGYAVANAVTTFYPTSETAFCINIGATLLQVSVIKEGSVVYSKEHVFGTDALLQDICMMQGLERDDAQAQLLADTLPKSWRDDTLPIFLSNLQQQINRAIQMYISTTHAQRPQKLLICGGGAVIDDIASLLSQDLGLAVEVFNPLANVAIDKKVNAEQLQKLAPQMTIALGLASRGFSPWHI
ncbi:type IV pilus assembly protein PilM [Alteromonas oceanisediminis]|uniref:type IV pilus assembly protein PilM n=1 Tax=Alteromonas oceanisediminis TaxID=2836180 RepID=UPI001BDAEAF5|nr:type IV pilus assembly protein PilM [Alteromonas oceanisediminis]MBT0586091.1 type IV pilus assembly protein PilM [Alteromonas oceanisediminis]